MALEITAARPDPALLDLPWRLPLEEWPEDHPRRAAPGHLAARRAVRAAVRAGAGGQGDQGRPRPARVRPAAQPATACDMPCVEPFAVVSGRIGLDGEPLDACLITRHLQFSLPYRALFTQNLRRTPPSGWSTPSRCCSCACTSPGSCGATCRCRTRCSAATPGRSPPTSSTPRPASCTQRLSDGQREHDLEIARVNIAGELMDLEAGGLLEEDRRPGRRQRADHAALPRAVGRPHRHASCIDDAERWRVDERIRRLNDLGFDIDELAITTDIDGTSIQIQPKVVDAGHHSRRLLRLTGLDVAREPGPPAAQRPRRVPAATGRQGEDEEIVAHEWLASVYEPVIRAGAARAGRRSSSRPRSSTRCSSTAGTWPSAPSTTSRSRRPSTTTSRRCCPASPTSRRCSGSTRVSCPSSPPRRGEPRIEGAPTRSRPRGSHDRPAARPRRAHAGRAGPARTPAMPHAPASPPPAAPPPCPPFPGSAPPPAAPTAPTGAPAARPAEPRRASHGTPHRQPATRPVRHPGAADSRRQSRCPARLPARRRPTPTAATPRRRSTPAGGRLPRVDRLRRAELRQGGRLRPARPRLPHRLRASRSSG